ncbi:hypothetical protein CP965_11005 [Halarcobacter mediterraneus]|uniref:Glycosyl transferase family 1 domain-containing protein n=1 Tax=Halarcobacter mediterraneus TaxID=2023153 RepID=A0A4V1M157_9BACT|nr:glycosyltransferase family 1 protein [Halarcobacter mediterraneus]RXK12286.1 hypothetical protein CP965_11005 [Halarcobacter mediterraneus]
MIYIDLTQYIQNRLNTGIQRVVNQYLRRALKDSSTISILYYDEKNTFHLLDNKEVTVFLDNVINYQFKTYTKIDIFNLNINKKIFFEIDSVWNSSYSRITLYKKLKEQNFKIYNFIYDLIPILFPQFLHEKTKKNFKPYMKAIFQYSDKVFFDSKSARNDFLKLKNTIFENSKQISTEVVYLGSDFKKEAKHINKTYEHILSKKFILFVGTIEPRKQQKLLLEAFEILNKTYKNLNIVFIGKIGWNVEEFIYTLNTHPLKDKNIFHFENIDDETLVSFYKKAFLVTYLSFYEGYGLPIVESLKYSNITIVSSNSSIPEVGLDFVEYIKDNSKTELIEKIKYYIENKTKYQERKNYIFEKYQIPNWDIFYTKLKQKLIK